MKIIINTICGTLICAALMAASCQHTDVQVVPLSNMTNDLMNDFFQGKAQHLILKCTEGMILPSHITLKGDFLALESGDVPHKIKILKTCYIRATGEDVLFSTDLEHWKNFEQFFTGMIGASLNLSGKEVESTFHFELNQRACASST